MTRARLPPREEEFIVVSILSALVLLVVVTIIVNEIANERENKECEKKHRRKERRLERQVGAHTNTEIYIFISLLHKVINLDKENRMDGWTDGCREREILDGWMDR